VKPLVLFCEYTVLEQFRECYSAWVHSDPSRWKGVRLLAGVGQPGVYVEIWAVGSLEESERIQKERREGRSWLDMEPWIKGGREGLHLWTFREVELIG
jgi:hypothetical protein